MLYGENGMDIQSVIVFCMEIIGTVAFSASGAMVGINKSMDVFGVCVLGVFTAVGGGMARDMILCRVPSALINPVYVAVAAATAIVVFAVLWVKKEHFHGRFRMAYDSLMLIMDSLGLGIFTVVGVLTGVKAGYPGNTFLLVFLGTLTGVGGGLTKGVRVVNLAMYAEMQGAAGVVVNAPTAGRIIRTLRETIDIPVIVTAVTSDGIEERIRAGASIINVAGGYKTAEIVREIRAKSANIPIIASGGDTDESVLSTIRAGANAIVWTPPSNGEVFRAVMDAYRDGKGHP